MFWHCAPIPLAATTVVTTTHDLQSARRGHTNRKLFAICFQSNGLSNNFNNFLKSVTLCSVSMGGVGCGASVAPEIRISASELALCAVAPTTTTFLFMDRFHKSSEVILRHVGRKPHAIGFTGMMRLFCQFRRNFLHVGLPSLLNGSRQEICRRIVVVGCGKCVHHDARKQLDTRSIVF